MAFIDQCFFNLICALIWSYYVHANVVYNLIGFDKKPASNIQPYRVEYVDFQQQCFAQCLYDTKCYSFAVKKDHLSCHIYNISLPHQQLVTSPNTEYYTEFRDCQDWYNFGAKPSGVYKVNWMGRMMKDVRCNMEIDGGGWLTFQRRFDGSVDFFEPGTWNQYKNGFGAVSGEFWIGNDLLHEITSSGDYYVLVIAESFGGQCQISKYGQFHIGNESNKYQLHFNESLLAGIHSLHRPSSTSQSVNGQKFSSADEDNDKYGNSCYDDDSYNRGPFWYNRCASFWPNGKYGTNPSDSSCGMRWYLWTNDCLKSMEIMIKRM